MWTPHPTFYAMTAKQKAKLKYRLASLLRCENAALLTRIQTSANSAMVGAWANRIAENDERLATLVNPESSTSNPS